MIDTSNIDVYLGLNIGLNIGRGEHHATALTPAGKKAGASACHPSPLV
ncbi:hypothetical protein HEP87_63920 [Streptomyces sp. S1D4-11]